MYIFGVLLVVVSRQFPNLNGEEGWLNRSTTFCRFLMLLVQVWIIHIDYFLSLVVGLTDPAQACFHDTLDVFNTYKTPWTRAFTVLVTCTSPKYDHKSYGLLFTKIDFFQDTGTPWHNSHYLRAGTVWDSKGSLSEVPGMPVLSIVTSTRHALLSLAIASVVVLEIYRYTETATACSHFKIQTSCFLSDW